MQNDEIARFPSIVLRLAALWVAAGALFKLFDGSPNDLPPEVQKFFLGKDLTFRLAISIELIFITTALLRPQWSWPWMAALFAVFLYVLAKLVLLTKETEGVAFTTAAFSSEVSCGCFGSRIKVPPGIMMAVDWVFFVLILTSRPWRRQGSFGPVWLPTGFAALAVVAPWFVRAGVEHAEVRVDAQGKATVEGSRYNELALADWVGQMIYDVDFLQKFVPGLDAYPSEGTYVFYRTTCEHCAAHIAELAAKDDASKPFVFVRLPEEGDSEENRVVHVFPVGGHVTHVELPPGTRYVLTTPAEIVVEGGIITSYRENIGRE